MKLENLIETKKADYYTRQLSKLNGVTTPHIVSGHTHIFHQYTIMMDSGLRTKLIKYLSENGIPTMIYYPLPLHLQPALKYLGYKKSDFPEVEKVAEGVLSLPIYPELPRKEQDLIIAKIKEFYEKRN